MKHSLLTLVILMFAVGIAHADDNRQYFGLHLGYANTTYRLNQINTVNKYELVSTPMNGFKFGVVYDATLVAGFGYSLGLNYTFASAMSKWEDYPYTEAGKWIDLRHYPTTLEYRTRSEYHQMEVFVDWQYKFQIAKDTWVMLYTGPTVQCVVKDVETSFVRRKNDGSDVKQQIMDYYKYSDELDNYFHRLNVTWGVGAGFQYKRYFLRGGYDFGLINPYAFDNFHVLDSSIDRNTRGRLDQWQIKLGIYLWEK